MSAAPLLAENSALDGGPAGTMTALVRDESPSSQASPAREQLLLSMFDELDREEARRAGQHGPLTSTSDLVRALGKRHSSGHARAAAALEVELALDRLAAHAEVLEGGPVAAAIVVSLCARGGMPVPSWLTPLVMSHASELRDTFFTADRRDPESDLPNHDPYADDGQEGDADR